MDRLHPEQIDELRIAFETFAKTPEGVQDASQGSISANDLRTVMLSLGQSRPDTEFSRLLQRYDPSGAGSIGQRQFMELMADVVVEEGGEAEIIEAFQTFDKDGDGYLTRQEFTIAMCNFGDRLSQRDVDEMLAVLPPDSRGVNYTAWVKAMNQ
ncbi:uncharacterized protein L969DRAFT_140553 [Mixia osmundae IAM 14324]|uniref:EF-hand domain-containing protein n=1 Tax=Mixia osmundae (strain CBS 9802 / IAM 14324 / JCM 22182 / KY 12970) TaxID=764103 RepID=G7EAE9_MIXOS|nr:uncharacterized protein L969DRAFT_140553 [Mixia osmundae IAM 14324]KEI42299.1 hypothetical protein L969DRAFT_140553 [Mixia osmundae IAM 14324]GAA99809.1 hypothetical protein E5Q_06512 [Mixia osmundae IAM 14324]